MNNSTIILIKKSLDYVSHDLLKLLAGLCLFWAILSCLTYMINVFLRNKVFLQLAFKERIKYLTYVNSTVNAITCVFLHNFFVYNGCDSGNRMITDIQCVHNPK